MLVGNAVAAMRNGAGAVQERYEVQRRSRADQRSGEGRCSGSCAVSNRVYVTVRKRNGRVDAQAGRWTMKCQSTRSVIGCCGAGRRTRSEATGAEVRLACLLGFSKRGRWQAPGTRIGSRPFGRVQKARAENRLLDVNQIETGQAQSLSLRIRTNVTCSLLLVSILQFAGNVCFSMQRPGLMWSRSTAGGRCKLSDVGGVVCVCVCGVGYLRVLGRLASHRCCAVACPDGFLIDEAADRQAKLDKRARQSLAELCAVVPLEFEEDFSPGRGSA